MTDVKIVPQAANAFNIELIQWKGNREGFQVVGILECQTDGRRLHILRREKNFATFRVSDDSEALKSKVLADAHSITIEV